MASTLHYIAVIVGLAFILSGFVKVAPLQPIHNEMISNFNRMVGVFPLKSFGIQPTADMYRALIGAAELIMGSLLAFGRHEWRRLSALGLLIIMIGAVYSHLAVKDQVQDLIPACVLGGALLLLLVHRNGFYGHSKID